MKRFATSFAALLALVWAGQADAAYIQYSETFTASGTLGGTAFTNATVTFTGISDTTRVVNNGGGNYQVPITTTVTISSIGTTPTGITDNIILLDYSTYTSPTAAVVFGDATNSSQLIGLFSPLLTGYNEQTPIVATGTTNNTNPGVSFGTQSGALVFSSFSTTGTFTAVVPEPSSLALTGLGLVLAGGFVRFRNRRQLAMEV